MQRFVTSSSTTPNAIGPYSHAVRANGLVFVSGQTPIDPETQQIVEGGIAKQTERCLANVAAILSAIGLTLDDVVRCVVYLNCMEHFSAMNDAYARHFSDGKPARTTVAVAALPLGALVEIEATAVDQSPPHRGSV
jgi:2-iminobutanoate/2-iminopropanoate deaminase